MLGLQVLLMLVSLYLISLGNSLPISTIYSRDGDIIDCIRREEQPAFTHPLLKNHIIQEYPIGFIKAKAGTEQKWQVWHETGEACPAGTISIRRELNQWNVTHNKFHPHLNVDGNERTAGHKYAVGVLENSSNIYGTRATFNVWDPVVEASGDFSLAQIWLVSGAYESGDLNTIEAGWQVYPAKYLDNQPRLFTYWTINGYNGTGCYNMQCSGFVQISRNIALGAAFNPTSMYEGTQIDITIQILKDKLSGNWWLSVGDEPVGYWPAAIYTVLSDHATRVNWGGEVYFRNNSRIHTKVQMGSGDFADKGFRKASYVANLKIADENRQLLPVQEFKVLATHPKYYTVRKRQNTQSGSYFYFGGPGPQLSIATHQTLASGFLFVSYLIFFVLV